MAETLGQQIARLNADCWWTMYPKESHREAASLLYDLASRMPKKVLDEPAIPFDRSVWTEKMRELTKDK